MSSTIFCNISLCTVLYLLNIIARAEALKGPNIEDVRADEYPFVASLMKKSSFNHSHEVRICTGVLLTDKHVLTAEHCLNNIKPIDIKILVGIVPSSTDEYNVQSWITYDQWERNPTNTVNDVAILTLSRVVQQPNFRPAALTNLNRNQLLGSKAVITGWAVINNTGETNTVFKKATVDILSRDECSRRTRLVMVEYRELPFMYLCTARSPNTLLEGGDSGGPLLDKNGVLLGINCGFGPTVSWGNFDNAFLDKYRMNLHPSIYYYHDFIIDVVISDESIGLICEPDSCLIPSNQNKYQ